jgi:hypothetical protein
LYNINQYLQAAIKESQGLGTAYEYLVKQKLISRFINGSKPQSILIAGLPQKYGTSEDFHMLARELKTRLQVSENPILHFDLALSCEVIQKYTYSEQMIYFRKLSVVCDRFIVFAPNRKNHSHVGRSGLNSVDLSMLQYQLNQTGWKVSDSGYLDIPPFPPGMTAKGIRENNWKNNVIQNCMCFVLNCWSRFDKRLAAEFPQYAHMIYCVAESDKNNN